MAYNKVFFFFFSRSLCLVYSLQVILSLPIPLKKAHSRLKNITFMVAKSILSILSHVVHGYVGNKAIAFPLQFLGWNVDTVNTTSFSNHPGYGSFMGESASAELIDKLMKGLQNIVDFKKEYELVLTGYIPNDVMFERVFAALKEMYSSEPPRKASGDITKPVWVLDPVMGDNGKLYMLEKVVPIYKTVLSSGLVMLTTPNQFEMELLSGVEIKDWNSLKYSLHQFYQLYKVPYVVLTSVSIASEAYSVASIHTGDKNEHMCIPLNLIDCKFSGSGDIFTALLAHAFYENGYSIKAEMLCDVLGKLEKILDFSLEDEKKRKETQDINYVKDLRVVSGRNIFIEDYLNHLIDKIFYI